MYQPSNTPAPFPGPRGAHINPLLTCPLQPVKWTGLRLGWSSLVKETMIHLYSPLLLLILQVPLLLFIFLLLLPMKDTGPLMHLLPPIFLSTRNTKNFSAQILLLESIDHLKYWVSTIKRERNDWKIKENTAHPRPFIAQVLSKHQLACFTLFLVWLKCLLISGT